MEIKDVLHPEIVRNLRGDLKDRQAYIDGIKSLDFPEATPTEYNSAALYEVVLRQHMFFCKRFVDERAPVYFLSDSFLEGLKSVDLEVPFDLLPDHFLGYFAFPKGSMSDGVDPVEGAYVFLGDQSPLVTKLLLPAEKFFWAYLMKASKEGLPYFGKLATKIGPGKKFAEFISDIKFMGPSLFPGGPPSLMAAPKEVEAIYRTIFNGILYLNSDSPKTEFLRAHANPTRSKTQTKKLKAQLGGKINLTRTPVTLVNFDAPHRSNIYHVDSTQVRGHFRWQRCGENRSKVKLIWIDEHVRTFPINSAETEKSHSVDLI